MATREPEHPPAACDAALTQAFGLLGKRWNGMIIGSLMTGPAGFSEVRRALNPISDSVLSERLAELTAAGLLIRDVDPGPPVGVRYRLAPRGEALVPVLRDLMEWARGNLEPLGASPGTGCPPDPAAPASSPTTAPTGTRAHRR